MLDILALTGLEWIYDRLEDRYGRTTAWLVTFTLGVSMIAALVAILFVIIR